MGFEQVEHGTLDGEGNQAGFCSAGVCFASFPARTVYFRDQAVAREFSNASRVPTYEYTDVLS